MSEQIRKEESAAKKFSAEREVSFLAWTSEQFAIMEVDF